MDNLTNGVIGLGKVLYNSSICYIEKGCSDDFELILTERITRKKNDGTWPHQALDVLRERVTLNNCSLIENRDIVKPGYFEEKLNDISPFFEFIKNKKMDCCLSALNNDLGFLTHHLAHAYSALFMSPFNKALIVVMDGGGSSSDDFHKNLVVEGEENFLGAAGEHEEFSVYSFENGKIRCVDKKWQKFLKSESSSKQYYSEGAGNFYEFIAKYIFNSKHASGKVMGLAPFGKAEEVESPYRFLENLDWNDSFKGNKYDWERVYKDRGFQDLAATVQSYFEKKYIGRIKELSFKFRDFDNLIITGGCALNCTSNMKIVQESGFKEVYIPPFPGDSGIAAGLAFRKVLEGGAKFTSSRAQHSFWGPKCSIPSNKAIEKAFSDFKVSYYEIIVEITAKKLNENNVIAWFQGRSESGPRSLGHRSILASVKFPDLNNYLNHHIKFREGFRPYGCSCPVEMAHEYFEIKKGSKNPFMSFSVPIKERYRTLLKEVMHVDFTSRMQIVSRDFDEMFYKLLQKTGEKSGVYCLLNTSLNIMGEPIVETIEDLKEFFKKSDISIMVVGDYLIEK